MEGENQYAGHKTLDEHILLQSLPMPEAGCQVCQRLSPWQLKPEALINSCPFSFFVYLYCSLVNFCLSFQCLDSDNLHCRPCSAETGHASVPFQSHIPSLSKWHFKTQFNSLSFILSIIAILASFPLLWFKLTHIGPRLSTDLYFFILCQILFWSVHFSHKHQTLWLPLVVDLGSCFCDQNITP